MTQIIGIMDAYAYGSMIQKVMLPRVVAPMMGGEPDEETINAGLPIAEKCLDVIEKFLDGRAFLAGDSLSLADLHFLPILTYFKLTPDSVPLLERAPEVLHWYDGMRSRASVERHCPEELR